MISKMPLLQLGITYDEIAAGRTSYFPQSNGIRFPTGAIPYTTVPSILFPIRVLRNVNLPAGRYLCKIVGVECASGIVDATTLIFPFQILQLKSPQILRQGGQSGGLLFSNNNAYTLQDCGGERSFYIQLAGGWLELEFTIVQLSMTTRLINSNATWNSAGFAFFILTLDVQLEDVKALYGNAK